MIDLQAFRNHLSAFFWTIERIRKIEFMGKEIFLLLAAFWTVFYPILSLYSSLIYFQILEQNCRAINIESYLHWDLFLKTMFFWRNIIDWTSVLNDFSKFTDPNCSINVKIVDPWTICSSKLPNSKHFTFVSSDWDVLTARLFGCFAP